MESEDRIIELIRRYGPSLPTRIAKELGIDSIIASAILANLSAKKKLKLSHLKIGGSPLYYLPQQEKELQNFASKLSGKEREAYELIKSKKIIRNDELEPAQRVAISHIRDFAKPLTIMLKNKKEIKFWKWYLLSNEEAAKLIKEKYFSKPERSEREKEEREEREEEKEEGYKTREERKNEKKREGLTLTKDITKNNEKEKKESSLSKSFKAQSLHSAQTPSLNIPEELRKVLHERRLIVENNIQWKGKEGETIAHIEGFENQKLLIYIINKKRINEKDIAMAHLKATLKKMPLVIVHKGEFTKDSLMLLRKINAQSIKF